MQDRKTGELLVHLALLSRSADQTEKGENGDISPVYICDAARQAELSPAAASRILQSLAAKGEVHLLRYGFAVLSEQGWDTAVYIMRRRKIVRAFLCRLTGKPVSAVTEECARIEYGLERDTVDAMERWLCADGVSAVQSSAEIHYEKKHNPADGNIDMP